jgi:hypothetical protein
MIFYRINKKFIFKIVLLCFLALPCIAQANIMYGGMDSGKTVFVITSTDASGSTEMNIGTKKGTYSNGDLLNTTWNGNLLNSMASSGTPGWKRCAITINSSGVTSGTCTDSAGNIESIGSASVTFSTSTGELTMEANPTWHCHLDSGKTVIACTETNNENTAGYLSILTKKGSSYSDANLLGVWYINAIESLGPYWGKGTIDIKSDYTFTLSSINSSGELETVSGAWLLDAATATVTVTPDGGTAFPCRVDANSRVMGCTQSHGSPVTATTLIVMTKKAASYSLSDFRIDSNTRWYTHSLLTGPDAPWWSRGIITPTDAAGNFTVLGFLFPTGSATFSGSGIAEISADEGAVISTSGVPECAAQKPVKKDAGYYNTVQGAYNSANADHQTVQIREDFFFEGLNFAGSYAVTLKGGYDCNYGNITGSATIIGKVTLSGAAVTVDGVIIK